MFDYTISTHELRNMLRNGDVDRDELTDEQIEEIELAEAEAERAEYADAYTRYMSEWQ